MTMGVGYYSGSDSFVSLRAANQQSESVSVVAKDDIVGGRVVTADGRLANPNEGLFAGLAIVKSAPVGRPFWYVPSGTVEVDNWGLTPGLSYFLGAYGTLTPAPVLATYIIQVGVAVNSNTLQVTFPLKVKVE